MPRKAAPINLRLLSKVSKMYYEQEMTQREISQRLFLSRPKISRLLKQAREEGIVQITIHSPPQTYANLEAQLEDEYGLLEAIVVESSDPESQETTTREIGIQAAKYLQRTIQDRETIGMSWGRSLNAMVQALQPADVENTHIVQLLGGLGPPDAESHATSLCRRMAGILNSKLTVLPAPGIVDNEDAKRVLLADRYIQAAFDMFQSVEVAYVGVGAPTPNSVMMQSGTILSQDDLDLLVEKGAVGDIALRFFNRDGRPVDLGIDRRVIGITLDQLQAIERVVGVTGGPEKLQVIRGALVGRWINVLITDHKTAGSLLGEAP